MYVSARSMASCRKLIKQTNDLVFNFVWDSKEDKITRTEMIAEYRDGHLKMLDIIEFNKALTVTWILKYISDICHSKWNCFFGFHLSKFGGRLVFTGNLYRKDAKNLTVKETFVQELEL